MRLRHVVCGGTFDHLHKGHEHLLLGCFRGGEKVTVGITDGAMVRHKRYIYSVQSYTVRRNAVLRFAALHKKTVNIVKLHDIFGPTIKKNDFDGLFITKDTVQGANMINEKRKELDMKPLLTYVVPLVYDENGEIISSERIREGLITRTGRSYYSFLFSKDAYILPESLRRGLRHPLGHIFSSVSEFSKPISKDMPQRSKIEANAESPLTISVGDVITGELQKNGKVPPISVIDGKTQRKALNKTLLNEIINLDCQYAVNEKGTIQRDALMKLYTLINSGHSKATKQLFVEGEEDLLTLPAILFAPLGSSVWYGQQGIGAVRVVVTEKKKEKVYNLLRRFD